MRYPQALHRHFRTDRLNLGPTCTHRAKQIILVSGISQDQIPSYLLNCVLQFPFGLLLCFLLETYQGKLGTLVMMLTQFPLAYSAHPSS